MALDIRSVIHCNLNCADLERSLRFYRDFVGLQPLQHTNPAPQNGSGFGMPDDVTWDAWMMGDPRGHQGTVIDLLEWKQPAPTARWSNSSSSRALRAFS